MQQARPSYSRRSAKCKLYLCYSNGRAKPCGDYLFLKYLFSLNTLKRSKTYIRHDPVSFFSFFFYIGNQHNHLQLFKQGVLKEFMHISHDIWINCCLIGLLAAVCVCVRARACVCVCARARACVSDTSDHCLGDSSHSGRFRFNYRVNFLQSDITFLHL